MPASGAHEGAVGSVRSRYLFSMPQIKTLLPAALTLAAVTLPVAPASPVLASPPDTTDYSATQGASSGALALHVRRQVSNQMPLVARVHLPDSAGSGVVIIRRDGTRVASAPVEAAASDVRVEAPRLRRTGQHSVRAVFRGDDGSVLRSEPVAVTSRAGCAWSPHVCGYPDATNTGPRPDVKLRNVPGDIRSGKGWHYDDRGFIAVTQDGAVVSGIESTHGLDITADNVTVRDSRFVVDGESFGIALRHTAGTTIRRVRISAPTAWGPQRLMVGIKDVYGDAKGTRISGSNISRTATGIQMDGGVIRDNYVHDLGFTGDDHVNGTTSNGSSGERLVLAHNTILNPHGQTDAISLFQDFGPQRNRRIIDNLLAGGGYSLYAGANPGMESTATDIVIEGNRFSRILFDRGGSYGPVAAYSTASGNAWSDNVWDESGATVHHP